MKIVIEIQGGLIQSIYADVAADIAIYDFDIVEEDYNDRYNAIRTEHDNITSNDAFSPVPYEFVTEPTHYKNFQFWTPEKLWALRQEIVLGSLYISDYTNSYGIKPAAVCNFFDGFLDYCATDLIENGNPSPTTSEIFEMDTPEILWEWFYCFEECPFDV